MKTFVLIREYAYNYKEVARKINELEKQYNMQFEDVYKALKYLLKKDKR